MHKYPSDISREQFEVIREDLEGAKARTRPRDVDLYDVFCAVLYITKSGCQWRMLPKDFPNWKLVYYYFTQWRKAGDDGESLLDRVLRKLAARLRNEEGRKDRTGMGIIDAQSVQNADSAEESGYDAGKKKRGSSGTS